MGYEQYIRHTAELRERIAKAFGNYAEFNEEIQEVMIAEWEFDSVVDEIMSIIAEES